jgi:hypothetical protein
LGERFVYLPTIFSSIFISVVLGSLASRPKLWRLAVFCLLVFFAVSLQRSNQRWAQAANLSKSILNDVVSLSKHNDLLILNVPGDLRGVPIYRNGLEDALRDFQQSKSYGRIDVVAFQSLRSTNDTSQVLQQSKFFLLGLSNEKEEFTRVNQKIECIGVDQLSRNSLRIRLEDCFKGRDVFYLSNGKMVLSL